jgi:hypothetical protein
MRTNDADVDSSVEYDFSNGELGRCSRRPGEGLDIRIDGAIGYSLRLIPSNKVVGRFSSTFDAWPAVLAEIERGIPARCLVLDWHWANGRRGQVSSGRLLVSVARSGLGHHTDRRQVRAAS